MLSSTTHHTMVYLKSADYEKIKNSAKKLGLSVSKYISLAALGRISNGMIVERNKGAEDPKQ